jgi:catechol-2,3-dioxygenase
MSVHVYGCNHVVIEVTDAKKAVKFYQDVFGLKMLRGGEGAAWCKLGEHQFMAIFEVEQLQADRTKHFGLMVRDAKQIQEVRNKLTKKYKLKLHPDFRCDFRDPWGNRIQVGDSCRLNGPVRKSWGQCAESTSSRSSELQNT